MKYGDRSDSTSASYTCIGTGIRDTSYNQKYTLFTLRGYFFSGKSNINDEIYLAPITLILCEEMHKENIYYWIISKIILSD